MISKEYSEDGCASHPGKCSKSPNIVNTTMCKTYGEWKVQYLHLAGCSTEIGRIMHELMHTIGNIHYQLSFHIFKNENNIWAG